MNPPGRQLGRKESVCIETCKTCGFPVHGLASCLPISNCNSRLATRPVDRMHDNHVVLWS